MVFSVYKRMIQPTSRCLWYYFHLMAAQKRRIVASNRIGIDLGGTKIEAIIMADTGDITHRKRIATPSDDYQLVLKTIRQLVLYIEQRAGITQPLPLGIGTPGAVSLKTGLMKNCNSTCLNGRPLKEDLQALMSRDVRIANDADCFTLSEAIDGAGSDANNVFGVILGTGVGGGVCVDKKLLRGANSIAGEWGHNPVTPPDAETPPRLCYCGRENCVEAWLSGPAFEFSYQLLTGQKNDAAGIARLAEDKDPSALTVMNSYHEMLARALSNVINILDPQVVVLGGGLSNIDSLYSVVPVHLTRTVFSDRVDTMIVKAKHGDASGVRGAAWLW